MRYLGYGLIIFAIVGNRALGATVTTLRFDDLPAKRFNNIADVIREEYGSFGVHFNKDGRHSGIVRDGIANGDPGNWNLNGTNGQRFLGHNSYGRTGRIDFDIPILDFLVDAAEGHGNLNMKFDAYSAAGLVDTETAVSPVGIWKTISLTSVSGIAYIEYSGVTDFGLDNIRFTSVPEPSAFLLAIAAVPAFLTRRR